MSVTPAPPIQKEKNGKACSKNVYERQPLSMNPRSASIHLQGEWLSHDLELLWVELEWILQLKVGYSRFDPVQDRFIYPRCQKSGFKI